MSQMLRRGFLRRFWIFSLLLPLVIACAAESLRSGIHGLRVDHQLAVARAGGRSLLHIRELVEPNTEFVVAPDGTVSLMHKSSGRSFWSFASGSPVRSSYQTPLEADKDGEETSEPSSVFFLDCLDETEFDVQEDNHYVRRKLSTTVEDFLTRVPAVLDDGVMLGSKTTMAFLVDGRSGRLIHVYNSLGSSFSDYTSTSGMIKPGTENGADLPLLITRTDTKLEHFDKTSRKLSWNLTVAHFKAALLCDTSLNFDHELGPEILTGVYMPLLCGSQTNVRWLIKSELIIKVPKVADYHERKQLPGSVPDHMITSQSIVDKFWNSNPSNEGKASLYLLILLSIIVYCSMHFIVRLCAYLAKKQLFSWGLAFGSYLRAPPSKKKKGRKLGKDRAAVGKNDIHLSPDSEDAFGFTESGNEMLLSINSVLSGYTDGRRIGKLSVSDKEIAKGSNGTVVFEGIYEGRPVAVKRLVQSHHEVAFKEIQNLIASDHHTNIVRWYGVERDRDFVYLALERCACSLDDLIQTYSDPLKNQASGKSQATKPIVEYKIRLDSIDGIVGDPDLRKSSGHPSPSLQKLMRDIVSGLAHLHELGIIHRDLKPQNVLITKGRTLCAKLSDMGISKCLPGDMSSLGDLATGSGSSGWQAPEQLLHGRQTHAVDMFSLGCVFFFCITGGKHPFGEHLERDVNIVKNKMDLFLVEYIPEAFDLISCLLNPEPELRPNAAEVLLHPLFWSSEMRLSFLRDASDRVELENREVGSDLLKTLESTAPIALGGKWDEKMEPVFINNIGRYRRYKFDSVRDLLRVIRNKLNHYRELPQEIQELVGPVPEGFDEYFRSRFPKLLIEVYRVICQFCKEEEIFHKYFKCSII